MVKQTFLLEHHQQSMDGPAAVGDASTDGADGQHPQEGLLCLI
jgi:hypothetical protein